MGLFPVWNGLLYLCSYGMDGLVSILKRIQLRLNRAYRARINAGPGQVVLAIWPMPDNSRLMISMSPNSAKAFAKALLEVAETAKH